MATYREIQEEYKRQFGTTIKTCWIAQVLAAHGLTKRKAPNRIDPNSYKYPCPPAKYPEIEKVLRKLEILKP